MTFWIYQNRNIYHILIFFLILFSLDNRSWEQMCRFKAIRAIDVLVRNLTMAHFVFFPLSMNKPAPLNFLQFSVCVPVSSQLKQFTFSPVTILSFPNNVGINLLVIFEPSFRTIPCVLARKMLLCRFCVSRQNELHHRRILFKKLSWICHNGANEHNVSTL